MIINQTVAPTALPVTIEECKQDLRITDDSHNMLIHSLIADAVDYMDGKEGALGRPLMSQTWAVSVPCFYQRMPLPFSPVQSISSIDYFDGANEAQTLDAATFRLHSDANNAWIETSDTLPTTYDRDDAVTFTLLCGYGSSDAVPNTIKRAIRVLVAHWFDNPNPTITGANVYDVPMVLDSLISMHKQRFVG